MLRSLPTRLSALVLFLGAIALFLSAGAQAQPGGGTKMRTNLPPYQPQGAWRPLDLNNISNLGFIQGTLGVGGLGGIGGMSTMGGSRRPRRIRRWPWRWVELEEVWAVVSEEAVLVGWSRMGGMGMAVSGGGLGDFGGYR